MSEAPIQDYLKHNKCWGCGNLNEQGLQIKSYFHENESVCSWKPDQRFMAGPEKFLNGGIIATIIDCHSICTAIANAYSREDRAPGSEPFIWYVTASLKIDYIKPTPIDTNVQLKAKVQETRGRKSTVKCSLFSGDTECARGEVLAVRVSAEQWYG